MLRMRREDVHVLRRARHPEVEHERPGDFGVLRHRRGLERHAGATGVAVRRRERRARAMPALVEPDAEYVSFASCVGDFARQRAFRRRRRCRTSARARC